MLPLVRFLLGFTLVFTALVLIFLVLIQRGRGGGLAGAFGGMGGQSAFGTKAGDVFTRITVGVAAFWILLCVLSINVLGRQQSLFSNALGKRRTRGGDGLGRFDAIRARCRIGSRCRSCRRRQQHQPRPRDAHRSCGRGRSGAAGCPCSSGRARNAGRALEPRQVTLGATPARSACRAAARRSWPTVRAPAGSRSAASTTAS